MARAWHPRLTTWVDLVDFRWQRLGLSAARRRQLRVELVGDLSQARRDGAPLDELLAVDPERFAEDVAIAHGWTADDQDADPVGSSPSSEARPRRSARGAGEE